MPNNRTNRVNKNKKVFSIASSRGCSIILRLLLLICCLLTSCGGDCIPPYSPQDEYSSFNICNNSSVNSAQKGSKNSTAAATDCQAPEKFNKDDNSSYWTLSPVKVAPQIAFGNTEYVLNVTPVGLSTTIGCPEDCGENFVKCKTDSCEIKDISANDITNIITESLVVTEGDIISFELIPFLNKRITEDTCATVDKRVYFANANICTEKIGEYYYSLIGNSKPPLPQDNILYYKTKGASAKLHKWIETDVLYSSDSTKALQQYTEKYNKDVNQMCALFQKQNPSGEEKNDMADIRKRMDIYTLNLACQGLAAQYYNKEGKKIEDNYENVNYAGPVSIALPTFAQEIGFPFFAFLPGVEVYIIDKDGNTLAELPTLTDNELGEAQKYTIGNKGLKLGYPYIIENLPIAEENQTFKLKLRIAQPKAEAEILGGYRVKITRQGQTAPVNRLYVYSGTSPPDFKPGAGGTPIQEFSKDLRTPISGSENNLYFGVKNDSGDFKGYQGYFKIQVTTKRVPAPILSSVISWMRDSIIVILYGSSYFDEDKNDKSHSNRKLYNSGITGHGIVGSVYQAIVSGPFLNVVQAALLLYIIIYSVVFLIGGVKTPQLEFVAALMKIAIIAVLFGPKSWDFFNNYLFKLFIEAPVQLSNIMAAAQPEVFGPHESYRDFYFVDLLLGRFLDLQTWVQLVSLFFSWPGGWIILFIILWGLKELLTTVFNACTYYFMALILVAILLCIAPIFIVMILFKRTKTIFDTWIKNLAQIAMLPVFIFASLAFLSNIVLALMYGLLYFTICQACIIYIHIPLIDGFCLFGMYTAVVPEGSYFPTQLTYIISFVIITNVVKIFVDQAANLARVIFGVFGAEIIGPAASFQDSVKSIFGKDHGGKSAKEQQQYSEKLNKDPQQETVPRDQNSTQSAPQTGAAGSQPRTNNSSSSSGASSGGSSTKGQPR